MRHVRFKTHARSRDWCSRGITQFHGKHNRANPDWLRADSVFDGNTRLCVNRLLAASHRKQDNSAGERHKNSTASPKTAIHL
jgi:hypothetical protein